MAFFAPPGISMPMGQPRQYLPQGTLSGLGGFQQQFVAPQVGTGLYAMRPYQPQAPDVYAPPVPNEAGSVRAMQPNAFSAAPRRLAMLAGLGGSDFFRAARPGLPGIWRR